MSTGRDQTCLARGTAPGVILIPLLSDPPHASNQRPLSAATERQTAARGTLTAGYPLTQSPDHTPPRDRPAEPETALGAGSARAGGRGRFISADGVWSRAAVF